MIYSLVDNTSPYVYIYFKFLVKFEVLSNTVLIYLVNIPPLVQYHNKKHAVQVCQNAIFVFMFIVIMYIMYIMYPIQGIVKLYDGQRGREVLVYFTDKTLVSNNGRHLPAIGLFSTFQKYLYTKLKDFQ